MPHDRGQRAVAKRGDEPQGVAHQIEKAKGTQVAVVVAIPPSGSTIAPLIGGDHVKPGGGQRQHHLAPAIGQLWEPVQQQDARTISGLVSGLRQMDAQAVVVVDEAGPDARPQCSRPVRDVHRAIPFDADPGARASNPYAGRGVGPQSSGNASPARTSDRGLPPPRGSTLLPPLRSREEVAWIMRACSEVLTARRSSIRSRAERPDRRLACGGSHDVRTESGQRAPSPGRTPPGLWRVRRSGRSTAIFLPRHAGLAGAGPRDRRGRGGR